MNKYFLLIIIFFISCSETGESEEAAAEQQRHDYTGAKLFMDMVDNGGSLSLTLSVGNFDNVDNMNLELKFNYNDLSISGFENGDFTNSDLANSWKQKQPDSLASFVISNIEGDGNLFTINFTGSNYEGTTMFIDLERLDIIEGGEALYFSCTEAGFMNNVACIDHGGYWRLNTEELTIESICYIDAHPEDVYVYDSFAWRQKYCHPIQNPW